jgi:transposase InsO family protein
MDEKMRMVAMYLSHEWSLAALCRHFEVSRKTGYKWISRYIETGPVGLLNQSRAAVYHPQAVPLEIQQVVLGTRRAHPTWGPRKLRTLLERRWPQKLWPASSTIGEILRRHGLTVPRRRSHKSPPYTQPFLHCDGPHLVWSADFKGWFMTGDGQRCDPLTISDNYSRYLLRCQAVRALTFEAVQPVFEAAFREYGLPQAIRTDNGAPFATTTVGGLSRLSIWWLKLGIRPERIKPGRPAQNGRHERMHRTLKRDTAHPPKRTWRQQQLAFDHFRYEYNHDRPHESLQQQTPASKHMLSPRPYPLVVPAMSYPDDMEVRWVKSQGDISWYSHHIYLSETLAGELVGLKEVDNDRWDIYFGPIRLAQLDSHNKRLIHLPRTRRDHVDTSNKNENKPEKVLPMPPV